MSSHSYTFNYKPFRGGGQFLHPCIYSLITLGTLQYVPPEDVDTNQSLNRHNYQQNTGQQIMYLIAMVALKIRSINLGRNCGLLPVHNIHFVLSMDINYDGADSAVSR